MPCAGVAGASRSWRQWLVRLARLPVVNCRGHYTISKLAAFHVYNHSTSNAKALVDIVLTTIPCSLLVLGMEIFPLDDPMLGWRANLWFFVRTLVTHAFVTASVGVELQEYFPALELTIGACCRGGIIQSVAYVAVLIAISEASGIFPVPYSHIIAGLCVFVFGVPLVLLQVYHRIPSIPNFYQRYKQVNDLISLESAPLALYAGIATVFMQLSSAQQLVFSSCLPLVKQVCRYLLWRHSRHVVDVMGAIIYGSGHLFHVLFTATCIQNAKSTNTLLVLSAWNIAQAVLYAEETKQDAKLRARLETMIAKEACLRSRSGISANKPVDLVADVLELMDLELEHRAPSPIVIEYLRLAPYHRYMTKKWAAARRRWAQQSDLTMSMHLKSPGLARKSWVAMQWVLRQQVAPMGTATSDGPFRSPSIGIGPSLNSIQSPSTGTGPPQATASSIARSTLRAQCIVDFAASMHRNELVLHRCFVSLAVPFLYSIYACVVYTLPNRKYHAFMKELSTPAELVTLVVSLVSFIAIELAFLTFHVVMMRRTLGVSAIRQIAFVLASQRSLMVAKSIALTLVIFSFPIAHCGNDLTFRFDWTRAPANATASG